MFQENRFCMRFNFIVHKSCSDSIVGTSRVNNEFYFVRMAERRRLITRACRYYLTLQQVVNTKIIDSLDAKCGGRFLTSFFSGLVAFIVVLKGLSFTCRLLP